MFSEAPSAVAGGFSAGAAYDRKCLIPLNVCDSDVVLACPNAIDGSPLVYRELVEHLTPVVRVFAFDARNALLERRPFSSVLETARYYVTQLQCAQPRGPYRLFGFSSGGIIALEMARMLRARGERVPLLVLGDTQMEEHKPLELGARLGWIFFAEIFITNDMPAVIGWGPQSGNPFWEKTADEKLRFLSTYRPLHRDSPEEALDATYADFELFKQYMAAYSAYQPQAYDGPIVYVSSGIPRFLVDRWIQRLRLLNHTVVDLGVNGHLQLVKAPGVEKMARFLLERIEGDG